MTESRIVAIMKQRGVDPASFDHFDYLQALQELTQLELESCPNRKRIVEAFAAQCAQKLARQEEARANPNRCEQFLDRMRIYESVRQQKLEAMRYISEKYDTKSKQLKHYPRINHRMARHSDRHWKDKDGLDNIPHEGAIMQPNESRMSDKSYSEWQH